MQKIGIALLILLVSLPAFAGIAVIKVDDPMASSGLFLGPTDALAIGWYQSNPKDVNIKLNLQPNSQGTGVWDAYVMDAIGPQTTPFDEIAHSTFSAPSWQSWVPVFQNLTLPAGQFYLVVGTADPNTTGGWTVSDLMNGPATTTLAPDVLRGTPPDTTTVQYFASGIDTNAATYVDMTYLPASLFGNDDGSYGELLYDVEVPEPSALVLVGGALLAFARALRRRQKTA